MDQTDRTETSASDAHDWIVARASLTERPTRWGSLTWVSARPLIASLNHALALHARGLVTGLRQHWSPPEPEIVELPSPLDQAASAGAASAGAASDGAGPDGTTFFLVGDTGEQDASQYVVAPALSAAARTYRPAFVMIMSDVIYPSGDVNDYPDGVYRPYRSADPSFRVDAPILGLPGNHDWYDGLAGFMYHFTGRDDPPTVPPDEAYAPGAGQASAVSRLSRILWRRPSDPDTRTAALRTSGRLTGDLTQPGPYYAVRTPDLLVVCIDTGIDGTIDARQGAWLRKVSREEGPKILVTGKPLVVDEEVRPCRIGDDGTDPDAATETVWDVVHEPHHGYVATVGGDIHNFQRYAGQPGTDGPQVHLVAGGGGAFLHATHTVSVGANDSRLRARPGRQYFGPPAETFPTRGESLGLFASLLVPTVRRVMIYLGALLLGAAVPVALVWWTAPAGRVGMPLAITAASILLGMTIVSTVPALRRKPRSSRLSRLTTGVIMMSLGLLGSAVGQLLDPARFVVYAAFLAGVVTLHAVANAVVRRSGWWRPADEFARNPTPVGFVLGLGTLALLVGLAQLALGWSTDPDMAVLGAVASGSVVIVVGSLGQWRRRRRLTARRPDGRLVDRRPELRDGGEPGRQELTRLGALNRGWHRTGLPLSQGTQAVCLLIGVAQLLVVTGTVSNLAEAVGALGVATLALVGCIVAVLLGWVGALLGLTAVGAAAGRRRGLEPRAAWGAAARATHALVVPVLMIMVGVVVAVAGVIDGRVSALVSSAFRAAVAPVVCLVVLVVALLAVDALRRRSPRHYPWFALTGLALAMTVGWGLFAWPPTRWVVVAAAAAAVVLLALGLVAAIGHLSFLGAYWLIVDPRTWARPTFTTTELDELFRVRETYPPQTPRPELVPSHVLRWARITSPALGEPGGILQKEVSEIFSSDEPPFYKSFLRLTTSRLADGSAELRIFLHRVYGTRRSDVHEVATVGLSHRPVGAERPV